MQINKKSTKHEKKHENLFGYISLCRCVATTAAELQLSC